MGGARALTKAPATAGRAHTAKGGRQQRRKVQRGLPHGRRAAALPPHPRLLCRCSVLAAAVALNDHGGQGGKGRQAARARARGAGDGVQLREPEQGSHSEEGAGAAGVSRAGAAQLPRAQRHSSARHSSALARGGRAAPQSARHAPALPAELISASRDTSSFSKQLLPLLLVLLTPSASFSRGGGVKAAESPAAPVLPPARVARACT